MNTKPSKTAHVEAVAALILASAKYDTARADAREARGADARRRLGVWFLTNLHMALRQVEGAGFTQGDLVRDTMRTSSMGHGYPFPPVKRLTLAMREQITALVCAGGLAVELQKQPGGYLIVEIETQP